MKIHILFTLLIICFFQSRAQRLPQYTITVALNDSDNSLDGFLTVDYTNNASDSIRFLWFNIYPNAFKSDRTAFSEYMLSKGRTDFYFSAPSDRGYINRLDFRAGENILTTEDHPQYIDIVKVVFDQPLAPGHSKKISTPFHVKLPYNFDGIGYSNGQYHLKCWFPAVAEYVKPLTSVDSISNMAADYSINFTVKDEFNILSPLLSDTTGIPKRTGALKTIFLKSSSVKDVAVTVVKPKVDNKPKSSASEHDIFRFFSGSSEKKVHPFKKDSALTENIKKIFSSPLLPAIGYNEYDGLQLGLLTHNYYHDEKLFSYCLAPVYAFRSKSVTGFAAASYKLQCKGYINSMEAGFTASTFSYQDGTNPENENVFAKLIKIVPFVKATLSSQKPEVEKTLTFRSYIINERDLIYIRDSVDPVFHQRQGDFSTRYINELTFNYSSDRVLYPYHAQLQGQQANNWYRINATGNYFFNYPKGGGMNIRLFAAKFGYIGEVSAAEKFQNLRYMPKLTAVRGGEDYTYSNYFMGRNNFEGFAGRQVMMRDGGLKLRTDLFEGLQGRSDDWVASVNANTTIPQIFPGKIPLKIFFDAGTYSEAWDSNNPNPRFLYVAGLQVSLFREILNIYAPVLYSKQFRDQLKSVPEENKFFKKVSFSIDIQKIDLKKLL